MWRKLGRIRLTTTVFAFCDLVFFVLRLSDFYKKKRLCYLRIGSTALSLGDYLTTP